MVSLSMCDLPDIVDDPEGELGNEVDYTVSNAPGPEERDAEFTKVSPSATTPEVLAGF